MATNAHDTRVIPFADPKTGSITQYQWRKQKWTPQQLRTEALRLIAANDPMGEKIATRVLQMSPEQVRSARGATPSGVEGFSTQDINDELAAIDDAMLTSYGPARQAQVKRRNELNTTITGRAQSTERAREKELSGRTPAVVHAQTTAAQPAKPKVMTIAVFDDIIRSHGGDPKDKATRQKFLDDAKKAGWTVGN